MTRSNDKDRISLEPMHRITTCTACPHTGTTCRTATVLIARLSKTMALAGPLLTRIAQETGPAAHSQGPQVDGPQFDGPQFDGIVEVSDCVRPCHLAFQAKGNALHVFGDVDPQVRVERLIASASSALIVAETGRGALH